jgi:heme-degrading monooxygenase HmoA
MVTITTRVRLHEGKEPEWDAAMRERLESARNARGWIAAQLLMPLESLDERVVLGIWETRADWEAWHEDPAFLATRERLDGLQASPDETVWHEVVADVRNSAG